MLHCKNRQVTSKALHCMTLCIVTDNFPVRQPSGHCVHSDNSQIVIHFVLSLPRTLRRGALFLISSSDRTLTLTALKLIARPSTRMIVNVVVFPI
jgi:hypothetical protein